MGAFYHYKSLRTYNVAFSQLFANISIAVTDGANIVQRKVPIHFASKSKILENRDRDPEATDQSFINNGIAMSYDMDISSIGHADSPMTQIFKPEDEDDNAILGHVPRPVVLNFSLWIKSRKLRYAYQILEQIIPYFDPAVVVNIKDKDNIFINNRPFKVALKGVTREYSIEADMADGDGVVIFELQFEGHGELWKRIDDNAPGTINTIELTITSHDFEEVLGANNDLSLIPGSTLDIIPENQDE